MSDFGINDMLEMQKLLQEKYKDKWGGLYPAKAREQLLWSIIEAGEAADIIKKRGGFREKYILENDHYFKRGMWTDSHKIIYCVKCTKWDCFLVEKPRNGPFYLVKLLIPYLTQGASIINISSSRDRMSQPQPESYTAAKGGIAALTHALAVSLAGKARVNSISPGWIDTQYVEYEGADALQQPVGRVGNPMDIANMVLFLCSEKAGFITGENICIDGGMTKQMIYHADNGWKLEL